MKECKILHIHDGDAVILENGNMHFLESYPWAENLLNDLLKQGYEVKQIIPQISPTSQEEGNWTFYKDGFIVYLEREVM